MRRKTQRRTQRRRQRQLYEEPLEWSPNIKAGTSVKSQEDIRTRECRPRAIGRFGTTRYPRPTHGDTHATDLLGDEDVIQTKKGEILRGRRVSIGVSMITHPPRILIGSISSPMTRATEEASVALGHWDREIGGGRYCCLSTDRWRTVSRLSSKTVRPLIQITWPLEGNVRRGGRGQTFHRYYGLRRLKAIKT